MATKRALDLFYQLPPGTAITRQPGGPMLIKCANQPRYRISELHIMHGMTGEIHYIGDFLPSNLPAEVLLKIWDVDPPLTGEERMAILACYHEFLKELH